MSILNNNQGGLVQNYVTQGAGEEFKFPLDWEQTFHHESKKSSAPREYVAAIEFAALSDEQRAAGQAILEYLANFRFATAQQLRTLVAAKGMNPDLIYDLISYFIERNTMNYFVITANQMQFSQKEIPGDALKVYCLDYGAICLLSHFSASPYLRWTPGDERFCKSQLVARHIMTGMFYLQALSLRKDTLEQFIPNRDFTNGERGIRFSAGFRIMMGCNGVEFLLDVVRDTDLLTSWQSELEKMTPFIRGKYMKRYYEGGNPEGRYSSLPLVIFLVESVKAAGEVADSFYRATGYSEFYILLERDMLKGLHIAPLYAYHPEDNKLKGKREEFFKPVAPRA